MLIRAFLARFFENDLTAGAGDLRQAFFTGIALLAMPGVIAPILMAGAASSDDPATWGWAMVARTAGLDAVREMALADKALYLGVAIVIALLLAAVTWSSLLPDRRDTLVLGPLPVRPRAITMARLAALLIYATGTAFAIHALSALAFGSLLATGNTLTFALRGITAHLTASVAAAACTTLAVTAAQALIGAVFGPRALSRASTILQWAVVSAAALLLVSLSSLSAGALDTIRGHGAHAQPWLLMTPPMWFLGLYERIVGTSDPVLIALANRALVALGCAGAATLVAQPLCAWRIERAAHDGPAARAARRATSARVIDLLARALSRQPSVRAVAGFYLTGLLRGPRQRLAMAAALAGAIAWGLPGWLTLARAVPAAPSLGLVLWPSAGLAMFLAGLRLASALPLDATGTWVFASVPLRGGVTRTAIRRVVALAVSPFVLGLGGLYWRWWGAPAAIAHTAVSSAEVWFLIHLLHWSDDIVPGTRPMSFDPGRLRRWWPLYLLGFLFFTTGAPALEYVALLNPIAATLVVSFYLAIARIAALVYDRRDEITSAGDASAEMLSVALRAGGVGRKDAPAEEKARDFSAHSHRSVSPELFQRPAVFRADDDRWLDGFSLRPSGLIRDARLATRRLARTPAFTAFAVITLALGAGATAADFSLVSALAPHQPIEGAERITVIRTSRGGGLSWPDYVDLSAHQKSFAAIGAQSDFPGSIAWRGAAALADGLLVTGDFFRVLEVRPAMGRLIQPADDRPDAPPVAVIADALWRTRFGADPSIVGSTVLISGDPFQVVGVLPPGFLGLGGGTNRPRWFYVPHAHAPLTDRALTRYRDPARRDRAYLYVAARLAPGASSSAAAAEVGAFGRSLDASEPLTTRTANGATMTLRRFWTARPLRDVEIEGVPFGILAAYLALPTLVLLVACTNLANLVLSRGATRRRELAVCRALGASRWMLVRAHIVELGIVAAAGGFGAFLVARAIIDMVLAYFQSTYPDLPQYQLAVALDWRAAVLVAGACLMSLAVTGLLPAITLTRGGAASLAHDAHDVGSHWRGGARLIAGQVAVSVVLLLVGALAVRSLMTASASRSGALALDRLAVVSLPMSLQQRESTRSRQQIDDILSRVREDPAVGAVTALAGLPDIDPRNGVDATTVDEASVVTGTPLHPAALVTGTPSIFDTLGVSIVAGRGFTETDAAGSPLVTVVSAHLARAVYGTTDVAGRQIRLRPTGVWAAGAGIAFDAGQADGALTVVGVAADTTSSRSGEIDDIAYVPIAQQFEPDLTFVARGPAATRVPVDGLVTILKTAIQRTDDQLAVGFSGRADVRAGSTAVVLRIVATIASALAMLALVLAMSGLYGVLSHLVVRRRREMAIRLAIGADPRALVRLIMIAGARPVAIGLAAGVGLAALARASAQPFVVGLVRAVDPLAVVLAGLPLLAAAGLACYLPARRAARTDPNAVLKDS